MRRVPVAPRPDHERIVREQGLVYNDTALPDGRVRPFWDESACYAFTLAEILELERVTQELHQRCLEAVEHVISRRRYAELGIPPIAWQAIEDGWERDSPSVYGRFDLRYDGSGPAKLLEYNADTPTSLLEAAVIQWHWLEDTHPGRDQWNALHERLVAAWRRHAPEIPFGRVHFAYSGAEESGEDLLTVTYLRETANQAGLATATLTMEEIGWDHGRQRFVAPNGDLLITVFKLYPWEWMMAERFGARALGQTRLIQWIEPPWKCILSNKAILAILWELFPDHPNLLPAYLDGPRDMDAYARKPILGREGANVELVTPGSRFSQPGTYGAEGYIYQDYAPLPDFDGRYPVLGAWVIDGEASGLGIREADTLVTDNLSRFVPHLIEG